MKKKKILVLCTGNSCRSQMAHGYLAQMGGSKVAVYSAGVETHGLNPGAVAIMKADGIDIAHHQSNHVEEYADMVMDYVITVCDHAKERCPIFPASVATSHENFPDQILLPAMVEGASFAGIRRNSIIPAPKVKLPTHAMEDEMPQTSPIHAVIKAPRA